MRKTKDLKSKKGITLMALIITIIIMLILVSVTISMAVNGGLFEYAGEAVGGMQNAIAVEQELANGRIQIGGKWYDSIDDYIKGTPSEGQGEEKRKINVEYTKSEGQDLWSSTVVLKIFIENETENISLEQKKTLIASSMGCTDYEDFKGFLGDETTSYDDIVSELGSENILVDMLMGELGLNVTLLTLEQKRELAAYMTDFSNYEEFKNGIIVSTGENITYEQAISRYNFENEESFLIFIIDNMKNLLNFKDIDKLESLGVKVASIKTPYDTKLYTTSLGGEVKCSFVENGTYTFDIESSGIKTQQTVEIDNIRKYDDQTPHDVKIDFLNDSGNSVQYSIDDSDEWNTLESSIESINNSISFKTKDLSVYGHYVVKDKDFYKYFSDDKNWARWSGNENAFMIVLIQSAFKQNYNITPTCRQTIAFLLLGDNYKGLAQTFVTEGNGEWADWMDEYGALKIGGATFNEEEMKEKYPQTKLGVKSFLGTLSFTKDSNICIASYYCLTTDTYVEVVVWDEEKKRKIRIRKKLKDVTYEDELLVWDFDKGEFTTAKPLWIMKTKRASKYNLLKFSDGSELKTIDQHRIFNKEAGKFTYPMTDETPIGTTTYTAEGKEVKLVSKEVIVKEVEYTNIITKYHMNVFANNILTSCRFSNLYPIEDMKYVKDDREIVGKEEYANIPEEYYYGLRLGEQPKEANRGNDVEHAKTIEEHIQRVYIDNAKEI